MNRDEVWQTIDRERSSLADLFEDLSEQELEVASLCAGWRVRDVAAHLSLSHLGTMSAVFALLRARGDLNRMIHVTAVRQAELPVSRYSALQRNMVGSRRKFPGISHFEPLIDVLVHGQDSAIPLGRERPMPPRAASAAATRVWAMGKPFYAQRDMAGIELVATDCDWSAGQGLRVEGPIATLLLLVTRRPIDLSNLTGPGVTELQSRLSAAAGW